MTTKAKRKKQTARNQYAELNDNIISLGGSDYSQLRQGVKIKPKFPYKLTYNQNRFIDLAMDNKVKIIFVSGLAGTAKTILSTYCGLKLLEAGQGQSLTYIRSIVESSDKGLGFLPGDLKDKVNPYMRPLEEKLYELLGDHEIRELQREGRIDAMPVNFLRGLDFRPQEEGKTIKVLILDEAQNLSKRETLLFLSRIGEGCKVFICGDPTQSDIRNSGFESTFNLFNDDESKKNGIFTFKLTEDDIVRSALVKFIVSKFKI
jgi:phosphate starvation-inducible PhoH-like protein